MPDYSGPIQAVELARWLWLVPLFPLLGALTNALYCSGLLATALAWLGARDEDAPSTSAPSDIATPATAATPARIALVSLVLSAAASVAYAIALFREPADHRFLLDHLWQLVRVGPVDSGVDLALDPLAAVLAIVISVAGVLVCLDVTKSDDLQEGRSSWPFFACFGGLVFFALMLVLADNVLLLMFGWQGIALTSYGLMASARRNDDGLRFSQGARGLQRAGDGALFLGVALLFWGLGGSWSPRGDYQSDLLPRIFAVTPTAPGTPHGPNPSLAWGRGATQGKGFLTVTALPDALVYADESRVPLLDASGLPLRTPFVRHEVSGGVHAFRIAPDDAFHAGPQAGKQPFVLDPGVLANYSAPRYAFGGDREVALAVVGPTLRFRELHDEMVIAEANENAARPVRDRLVSDSRSSGARGPLVLGLACLLLLLGACTKIAAGVRCVRGALGVARTATAPHSYSLAALASGAAMMLAGAYLVGRLGFVFSLVPLLSTHAGPG